MEDTIKQTGILEKTGVFDEDLKKRYELTICYNGIKGKKILVIGLNPASDNIQVSDTTTNYLMNNLFPMGYSTITIWNLYADICTKLKPGGATDNDDNIQYLKEILERDLDAILIGYGNTFLQNRKVRAEKARLLEQLQPHSKKVYELVDKKKDYERLHNIHPLFAGQRFSGEWRLRRYVFPKSDIAV